MHAKKDTPNKKPDILAATASVLNSANLFGKEKLIIIQHKDVFYRLMITRQDKLILTK